MKKSKRGNIRKSNGYQYKTPQEKRVGEAFLDFIQIDFDGNYGCYEAEELAIEVYNSLDKIEEEKRVGESLTHEKWRKMIDEKIMQINQRNKVDTSLRSQTGLLEDVYAWEYVECPKLDCADMGGDGLCMIRNNGSGCNRYTKTSRKYSTRQIPESKKK